jgi:hypothetical protein
VKCSPLGAAAWPPALADCRNVNLKLGGVGLFHDTAVRAYRITPA